MLWPMSLLSVAPQSLPDSRLTGAGRAVSLAADFALGFGAALWVVAAASLFSAWWGTSGLGAVETWIVFASAWLPFAAAPRWVPQPGRISRAPFASAALVAVSAMAMAVADGAEGAGWWVGMVVLSVPVAACGLEFARRWDLATARGDGSGSMLWLRGALGAAVAIACAEMAPGVSWPEAIGCSGVAFAFAFAGARTNSVGVTGDGAAEASVAHASIAGAIAAWGLAMPYGAGPIPVAWPLVDAGWAACLAVALGCCIAPWLGGGNGNGGGSGIGLRRSAAATASAICAYAAGSGSAAAAIVCVAIAASLLCVSARAASRRRAAWGFGIGALVTGCAAHFGWSPSCAIAALTACVGAWSIRWTASGWIPFVVGASVAIAHSAAPAIADASGRDAGERPLSAIGVARASWEPRTQDVVLCVRGREVDRAGPHHHHADLVAAMVALYGAGERPIANVDQGVGAFAESARAFGLPVSWCAEPCADVVSLRPRLAVDGPARGTLVQAVAPDCVEVGARALLRMTATSACGAVVDATLLGAASSLRATIEEHAAMRRVAGDGPVVFAFALDRASPRLVAAVLSAASNAHPFCRVVVSDRTAVVACLTREPDPRVVAQRFAQLSLDARWRLHAAGIGSPQDLDDALVLDALPHGRPMRDADVRALSQMANEHGSEGNLAGNLRVLRSIPSRLLPACWSARLDALSDDAAAWPAADSALANAVRAAPGSVLLRRELVQLRVRRAELAILAADRAVPEQVANAAAMAARFLPFGCPSPVLQAALALPDRVGQRLKERRAAANAALAIDPSLYGVASPLLRDVLEGSQPRSPIEDFARLPSDSRLCELAVQEGPLAVALRTLHGSRCARALVDEWGRAELSNGALSALRELADPFVLEAANAQLARRSAQKELVRIWRADLPATAAMRSLLDGTAAQRQALMVAIAGRVDEGSLDALGKGLVDEDEGVRNAAGAALFRSIGDSIAYDPNWPQDRLREAAAKLATLPIRTSR